MKIFFVKLIDKFLMKSIGMSSLRSREDDFERIAMEEAMAEQRKLMEASRSNQARGPSGPEVIALDDSDDEDRHQQRGGFRGGGANFSRPPPSFDGPNRGGPTNFGGISTHEPFTLGGRVPPQPPRLSQPSWQQQQSGNQWRY